MTPTQNRVTARVQIPLEVLTKRNRLLSLEDQIHNHINAQLIDRIADEILRNKSEAIEIQEIHSAPSGPQYRAQVEYYVFTKQELEDLLRRTKIEASMDVMEASFKVSEWKNSKQ